MNGHLIAADGSSHPLDTANVQALAGSGTQFWADIEGVDDEVLSLLRDTLNFHPLAVEDAEHFGQRPKIDMYDDFALLVVYGTSQDAHLVEVHCFYTQSFLVTVHNHPCPDFRSLSERLARTQGTGTADHVMLLYRVVDTLVDGYFPVLSNLDDQIDELEDEILERPTEEQLGRLFDMKRSLIALRKVITPQRDMFASLIGTGGTLPGMTPDAERYFRDLYDHLIRISDLVDSYRDLLSGALDTHLSTVSNRLNVVMKQLTIIATIFLPLSFLTGFFGQNFGWMVNRITSWPVFMGLGVGLQLAVVIGLLILFRRRGWLTADGTVPPATPAKRARFSPERRWHVLGISPLLPGKRASSTDPGS